MPFIHLKSQLTTTIVSQRSRRPTMHGHHHNAHARQSSHVLNTRHEPFTENSFRHNPGQTPRMIQTDFRTPKIPDSIRHTTRSRQRSQDKNTRAQKRTKSDSPLKDQDPPTQSRRKDHNGILANTVFLLPHQSIERRSRLPHAAGPPSGPTVSGLKSLWNSRSLRGIFAWVREAAPHFRAFSTQVTQKWR